MPTQFERTMANGGTPVLGQSTSGVPSSLSHTALAFAVRPKVVKQGIAEKDR